MSLNCPGIDLVFLAYVASPLLGQSMRKIAAASKALGIERDGEGKRRAQFTLRELISGYTCKLDMGFVLTREMHRFGAQI